MLTLSYLSNLLQSHVMLDYSIDVSGINTILKLNVPINLQNIKNIISTQSDFLYVSAKKSFFNCITIVLPKISNDNGNKKHIIKIFSNGTFIITRCTNEYELFHIIQKLNDINIIQTNQIDISSVKFNMIGVNFNHINLIDTNMLAEYLKIDNCDGKIILNIIENDILQLKVEKSSIIILPSGRITIIGKDNYISILESYKFITGYLALHCDKNTDDEYHFLKLLNISI
jgi:hypothetical protein